MTVPQFKHARVILELLENRIKHMGVKWQLYHSIGYLPETTAFDDMLGKLKMCQGKIRSIELMADGTNKPMANSKFTKVSGNLDPKYITEPSPLLSFLYHDIESISDILNALNYGFLNRLVGVVASEPTLGMEIASRQFGGIQLIHNATESLMKDYVESVEYMYLFSIDAELEEENLNNNIFSKKLRDKFGGKRICPSKNINISKEKNKRWNWIITDKRGTYVICKENEELKIYKTIKYEGIVVFGFRNRAVTHPPMVVHYPSYAEHDLEYLLILAHEAYHLAHSMISGETAEKLRRIQEKIEKILMDESLASLYFPETIKDKNAPDALIANTIADDIMADIYATLVAGEAYPLIVGRYYLPILLDTNGDTQPPYSSFVIGSLKIRVAVAVLETMNWRGNAIERIIKNTYCMIDRWEDISIKIAPMRSDNIDVKDTVVSISDKLRDIPKDMIKLIARPYYPEDKDKRVELQYKLETVKNMLIIEPTPKNMAEIWEDGILTPRHLISLLAQNRKHINRNAVLIAMGYHENILDRFEPQKKNHGE